MEILRKIWKKNKWLLIIPFLVAASLIYIGSGWYGDRVEVDAASAEEALIDEVETDTVASEEETEKIYVDVEGAVAHSGVVILESGARVFEAVESAGGCTDGAETRYINLAAICSDGQKIYIPTAGELEAQAVGSRQDPLISYPDGLWDETVSTSGAGQPGKVNINTAGSAELQTLTGIGPSMADRIISHREENGRFASAEDLTQVSGIGEKTLSKIIDKICV